MRIRSSNRMSRSSVAWVMLFLGAACAEVPEFASLDTPLPIAFAATPDAVMPRQVDVIWWRHLTDPTIDTLVQRVYADNLDLGIAALRVTEAEALRTTVASGLSFTGDTSGVVRRDLNAEETQTGQTANFGLSWLFDPFKGRAAGREAAANSVIVAKAELASARQVVVASLLNAYVDLRFQQARRANILAEIDRRSRTISQQQRIAQTGDVTEIELTNARAQLAGRRAELPLIDAEIGILKNQIAILTGLAPEQLDIDLSDSRLQPVPATLPEPGLPADLLRNRADLFILERNYYAARLDVTQARASLYPRLSLGGTISSSTVGDNSRIATFGPRLELPALPSGATQGQVEAAEIRVRIAFEEWKQGVLTALSGAEAALLKLHANATALRAADQSVALSRRSLELTQQVLAFDGATLDDVIVAEDRVAQAQDRRSQLRRAYARAFIDLQVQLGSGEVIGLGAPVGE